MSYSKKYRKYFLTGAIIRKKNTLKKMVMSVLSKTFQNDEFLKIFILTFLYMFCIFCNCWTNSISSGDALCYCLFIDTAFFINTASYSREDQGPLPQNVNMTSSQTDI